MQTAPVAWGNLTETLAATGTLAALTDHAATVSPPVAGTLAALTVRVGQSVRKGQVVARLSTGPLQGQIMQAQAQLDQSEVQVKQAQANALEQQAQTRAAILQAQSAVSGAQATLTGDEATLTGNKATLREAQTDLDRDRSLLAEGLVAEKDVQDSALAVRAAQATADAQRQTVAAQVQTVDGLRQALAAAQAGRMQDAVKQEDIQVARQQVQNAAGALATARAQERLDALTAPLSGQVTAVNALVGETVDPASPLLSIADLSVLALQIALPAENARQVQRGQTVFFAVPGLPGRQFQTTVHTVASQVDPATGTISALARVANPGRALQAESTVPVQVVVKERQDVLTVPAPALLRDPQSNAASVVVIDAGGIAHVVPVSVGLSANGRVEITHGLRLGQTVVVSGQYGLPDGTHVRAQASPTTGAAP